jgi:outer membrane protein assembly factor BamD (BamD/ComL family)
MHLNRNIITAALFFILCFTTASGLAQLGFSFDIKKPNQFDDRVLGSEKSETKKFTLPRRFTQNTFTHYNYFFNANNKLNQVLEEAKTKHVDDYNELLSFYNYSLDATAENRQQLDSIIYKATTGIVLHDLRNDWIDNLYLLTGAAYYLRKQFDSAYLTFQFINYAFADKEKDGYYKTIGSRFDGNDAFSIATKEKNSLPRKVFSEPPSRNEAFIWLIRTLIAQEEYAESASLIVTLNNDPVFPKRLRNDLEEVQALWFYKNNVYDSAAVHLGKALGNAKSKKEKSRWEFLIAQLYERSDKYELAQEFYEKVIHHTIDPVMEVYARLHSIRMNKSGENVIERNIAELLKMAKRDKYIDYRDVIYFTLAQLELERSNPAAAQGYFAKSIEHNTGNTALKNKAWLQLAELAFTEKKYRLASNSYDSINLNDASLKNKDELVKRKEVLGKIATQIEIIGRQDSLQKIAAMSEDERKDFVRKIVRQIRKQQGLKDETPAVLVPIGSLLPGQPDIFAANTSKGEWYFYNASLRTKGLGEFKARWGNRPNVDNWRRAAGMSYQQASKTPSLTQDVTVKTNTPLAPGEISFDALYENLPLTEEKLDLSNDSLSKALFTLGKALTDELEDCQSSIKIFEELAERFPKFEKLGEALFSLYYCYKKTGDEAKAAQVKKLMEEKYASHPLTKIITTGKDPRSEKNPEATKAYEQIYDLFIEGDFEKALAEKAVADSLYGSNYWTPQLLYIESVYYIKQRQDDKAEETLQKIISQRPGTAMADKAQKMIDVLSRRQQIENELAGLNIVRPKEEKIITTDTVVVKTDTVTTRPLVKTESVKIQPLQPAVTNVPLAKTDSITSKPPASAFTFNAGEKHYAMLLLNRVDLVWVNETKNAFSIYNRGKFYNKQFEYTVTEINPEYRALLIGVFDNAQQAVDYINTVKQPATTTIIPWLNSARYSYSIITAANLDILKSLKDVNLYRQFVEKNLPGKF